ncbi:phosphohydrolase [Oleiphilus sp. HI0125]|uniref:HD domain-containing protein n=1 Tax=Oleiphilus sp. HI0125 TaxID=1822266 RepID=UPI0007C2655E|nr:HD domain-containing protein [Oleiphilus sp. HI0125]KZZ59460.1 phosphohydrolase [Oleiphilus sp. HI0125]
MQLRINDLLGNYHKLIMDPVHGGIPVSRLEVAIIDHPLFQRLRFICQNDILSLVFPGATHSRFLHSVGAMHVGGRMFMAMVENGLKTFGSNASVSAETLEAISYFHRIVRCACLLHDSGHSSFSHQFSRTPTIQNILSTPGIFEQLWSGEDSTQFYAEQPSALEHEHYSVRVAHHILQQGQDATEDIAPQDIIALMETSATHATEKFSHHAKAMWPLVIGNQQSQPPEDFPELFRSLLSNIVSGELDADRADYMLRDGFHSSVTIGSFNLDHLLSNLKFGRCSQTGWVGIGIAAKGLSSLEDFVYSRHQMYRQVYAHKTAQGFDLLLRAAIEEVMKNSEVSTFIQQCLSDLEYFQHLSDSYFWEAFRRYSFRNKNSYSYCILNRIKMPHLSTKSNLSDAELPSYIKLIAQEHAIGEDDVITAKLTARFTKIDDSYTAMKVLEDSEAHELMFKRISKTTQFFDQFKDDQITHFYIDPTRVKA